jgi:hypothetical protein
MVLGAPGSWAAAVLPWVKTQESSSWRKGNSCCVYWWLLGRADHLFLKSHFVSSHVLETALLRLLML